MPQENTQASIKAVLENLGKLKEGQSDVMKTDLMFLKLLMDCPVVQSLARAHDTLDNEKVNPEQRHSCEIVSQILHDIHGVKSNTIAELTGILQQAHLRGVLKAHDKIAEQRAIKQQYVNQYGNQSIKIPYFKNAVRMVGLTKPHDEPLGMMVAIVNHEVVVTRIIHGALVHKQGLLNVGDIIKEINGQPIKGKPEVLKELLGKPTTSFILKVVPSYNKPTEEIVMFVQCNYDYDVLTDTDTPSKNAGLSFKQRDVLQIVNCSDKRWWQAQHINEEGEPDGRAGLIPSPEFQERRCVKPNTTEFIEKPVREMYCFSECMKFDTDQSPLLYEEVCRMPGFSRKVVVLVSEDKSIASKMKFKIAAMFEGVYKIPLMHSSNEECKGNRRYVVTAKEKIFSGIKANEYLEYAEQDSHMYGLKYGAIRDVLRSKKLCITNVASKNLKFIMNSEFMPFVVHVTTDVPDTEDVDPDVKTYSHMYNLTVPFTNEEDTGKGIHNHLEIIKSKPQWLPLSWVY